MQNKELTDDFLAKVLKSTQTEKPGTDFTLKVMSDIRQFEREKVEKPFWTWKNIFWIFGALILTAGIIIVLSPFIKNLGLFDPESIRQHIRDYFSHISGFFSGFSVFIEFLKGSSLSLIVFVVITILLTIELLLKRFSSRTYLFLF
ncbi:MAG: hypothetical protein WBJ84_00190 [Bacteroidales bacterium]